MSDPNTDPYVQILKAGDPNFFIFSSPTIDPETGLINGTQDTDTEPQVAAGLISQWSYSTIAIETAETDFSGESPAKRRVIVVTSATTVTLPDPTEGIDIYVKKSNVAGTVTVNGDIDGGSSVLLNTANYESLHLIGNGTEWMVV